MPVTRPALTRHQKRQETAHAPPTIRDGQLFASRVLAQQIHRVYHESRGRHPNRTRRTTVFHNSSLAELMSRLHQGDQEAARRIFQTFSQRLIALARSRLHGPIRAKADPEDVMASVFKSFFRRNAEEAFHLSG